MSDQGLLAPELLLHETRFVRALAHHLASDSIDADDLAQETLLTAWERQPQPGFGLRAWLRSVATQLTRRERRSAARRMDRERRADAPTAAREPHEVVAHFELVRMLVDEVDRLREPHRSAILLRYFEEQPPHEMARRLGVPAATMRSRLKRALEELRVALDRRHANDRRRWQAALLAFARPAVRIAPAVPAAFFACAAVGVMAIVLWCEGLEPSPIDSKGASEQAPLGTVAPSSSAAVVARREARDVWRDAPIARDESARRSEARSADSCELVGRLVGLVPDRAWSSRIVVRPGVDVDGAAIVDATRELDVDVLEDGTFHVDLAQLAKLVPSGRTLAACTISTDDPWFFSEAQTIALDDGRGFGPGTQARLHTELVVTLAAVASGRVTDEERRPIRGVHVLATPAAKSSSNPIAPIDRGSDTSPFEAWEAFTDERGEFRIRLPEGGRFRLRFSTTSHREIFARQTLRGLSPATTVVPLRAGAETQVSTIVLERGCVQSGVVRRPDGSAAANALVLATPIDASGAAISGKCAAWTDAEGGFELGGLSPGRVSLEIASIGRLPMPKPLLESGAASSIVSVPAPRLALDCPTSWLHVRVDEAGRIVRDGSAIAIGTSSGRQALVVEDGAPDELHAEVVPGESVEVTASAPGCAARTEKLEIERADAEPRLELELAPARSAGRLTLRLDGAPVARAWVAAESSEERHQDLVRCLPVVADRIDVDLPRAGAWKLRVRPGADGNGLGGIFLEESLDVDVPEHGVIERTIVPHPGARLRLRVESPAFVASTVPAQLLDSAGAPVELYWVSASGPRWILARPTLPRCDFAVADRPLEAGTYVLRLSPGGGPPEDFTLTLDPFESLTRTLPLRQS